MLLEKTLSIELKQREKQDAGKWEMAEKYYWCGKIISVQPRIRLDRSFDQVAHTYMGFLLRVDGGIDNEKRVFTIGIGKKALEKHYCRFGDEIEGSSLPVPDSRKEPVEYYKTSKLKLLRRQDIKVEPAPPWLGTPLGLEIYRSRGHRRLAARTYTDKCIACIWGCCMPVVMSIDHWNPGQVHYRFETFCYGPLSCSLYKAGPKRKVPGRKGMVYIEEDWVDEDATSHRSPDE
jgi:hypothetical protein